MSIQIGVGKSKNIDPLEAVKEAASIAQSQLSTKGVDTTIVFASAEFDPQRILQGIISTGITGNIIGFSSAAEISSYSAEEKSVVILTLTSDTLFCSMGIGENANTDPRNAGLLAARSAYKNIPLNTKNKLFILCADAIAKNNSYIIRGAQEILGTEFPIVGTGICDNMQFNRSYQYYNGQLYSNAICGILFHGKFSTGIGTGSGWNPIGRTLNITHAKSNIIEQINNQPAIKIYEKYTDLTFSPKNIKEFINVSTLYPLGIFLKNGNNYLLRTPIGITETGGLICSAEVPVNCSVKLMMTDISTVLETSTYAVKSALTQFKGKKKHFCIIFSSINRKRVLGRKIQQELAVIKKTIGENIPIIGCYGYGCIAPLGTETIRKQSLFQSEIITAIIIGE